LDAVQVVHGYVDEYDDTQLCSNEHKLVQWNSLKFHKGITALSVYNKFKGKGPEKSNSYFVKNKDIVIKNIA